MNAKVLSIFCLFLVITPFYVHGQESQIRLLNPSLELRVNERIQLEELLGQEVLDFSDINDDLEDALALMALLDDYVGVSNTNMHLRAASGRPARVLVTHPGEYRWQVDGEHSPWFPDFQLYRQAVDGDWQGAFTELSSDIKAKYE